MVDMRVSCSVVFLGVLGLNLTGCAHRVNAGAGQSDVIEIGASVVTERASTREAEFSRIMHASGVPGAQLAYSRGGQAGEHVYGVKNAESDVQVTSDTVFQAASLSKVVAAYVALRLVDQGVIDLDQPLWDYWGSERVANNPQARKITARMVLNHTTGLKNWQVSPSSPDLDTTPLDSMFPPGEKFLYSGEGFYLLQKTIEHVVGMEWNELARKEVFTRFDMPNSSYATHHRPDDDLSSRHARDGSVMPDRVFSKANSAYTLTTTARDYDNFIRRALYEGEGLDAATHDMMFAVSSSTGEKPSSFLADQSVDWGLGIGIQTVSGRQQVWHWGDNPGFKAFFMLDPESGDRMVIFTNSENGAQVFKEVLERFLGEGSYPAVDLVESRN